MGKKSAPQHANYEEFEDTPWITQAREIADIGGKGVLENYNNVNWFDNDIRNQIEQINEDVYNRAFGDMNRQYNDTMNAYAARNYNRFGTLNATPSAYLTDEYKRDFQRQMDDLAYNKAVNYENLVDKELQRRYNTLNMYNDLYQYGVTPHNVDLANWNTRNTNKDIQYQNAVAQQMSSGGGWAGALTGAAQGALTGAATGNPYAALGGAGIGGVGGYM